MPQFLLTIHISEGNDSIQVGLQQLSDTLHMFGVVDGEQSHMVSSYVAQLASRDVHLNVHAGPVPTLV